MIIGLGTVVTTLVAWAINKAAPAVWKGHQETKRVELMKELCLQKNDCEALKKYLETPEVPEK